MKRIIGLTVLALILNASVASTNSRSVVDGDAWFGLSAFDKIALVKTVQKELSRQGMSNEYAPEFYLAALNEFYVNDDNNHVNFADAMSMIGWSLGDFELSVQEATSASSQ